MSITTRGWGGSGTISIAGWGGRAVPTPPVIPPGGGGGGSYGLPGFTFPPDYQLPDDASFCPDIEDVDRDKLNPEEWRELLERCRPDLEPEPKPKPEKPKKKRKKKADPILRVAVGVLATGAVVHGARKIGKSLMEAKDKGLVSGVTGVLSGGSILMKALEAGKVALGESPPEPELTPTVKKKPRRKR